MCYDISIDPAKGRWYLDASWKCPASATPVIDQVVGHRVLAVDLNAGHLAATAVDPSGNPIGQPITIPVALAGLSTTTRDGHLRAAISTLLATARANGCRAVVIEDLDFHDAREMAQEAVGVLVRGPLPGRVGIAEVDLDAGGDRDVDVLAHLGSLDAQVTERPSSAGRRLLASAMAVFTASAVPPSGRCSRST